MTYLATKRQQQRWKQSLGDVVTSFPASVEAWRPLLEKYRGDIPIDFLLAWLQKESNGNACSWTYLRESGIFQLMWGDNLSVAGVTEPQLRAACVGDTQQQSRQLTYDEAEIQVSSGIRYVRWAMDQADKKLASVGVSWPKSSPDYWKVVKLIHAYPGYVVPWFTAATQKLGHRPADWAELRSTISGYASVLDNAEWVGARSNPSILGGSLFVPALLLGGLTVVYLLGR